MSIDTKKLLESEEYILRKNEILKKIYKEKFIIKKLNYTDKLQLKKIMKNYEYLL